MTPARKTKLLLMDFGMEACVTSLQLEALKTDLQAPADLIWRLFVESLLTVMVTSPFYHVYPASGLLEYWSQQQHLKRRQQRWQQQQRLMQQEPEAAVEQSC